MGNNGNVAESPLPGISASGSSDAQSSSVLQSPEDDDLISARGGRKRCRQNNDSHLHLFLERAP